MAINMNEANAHSEEKPQATIADTQQTTCCIVGGGPAGVVLAYILASRGIDVTLLEKNADFDRDFRGDTLHPAIMELMDQLGLADRLLQLPHTKLGGLTLTAGSNRLNISFSTLKTKYPYITFMPQAQFLAFLANEAKQFPNFHLITDADVKDLVEANGKVCGVRYQSPNGWHEVRALLTVAADGRFSKVRHLVGFAPLKSSSPIDVLWFRLPRRPEDGEGVQFMVHNGSILVMINRSSEWQFANVIAKGRYKQIQAAGLDSLRQTIATALPQVADRVNCLTDWRQFSLLAVESSRCPRWYKPGLLLIGDAAHVMSPVAGVGICYAVQDAIAAANLLTIPLKQGSVSVTDLAAVQKEREWPTKVIQRIQSFIQDRVISGTLGGKPFKLPFIVHIPLVRRLAARVVGFGVRRERLKI